MRFYMGTIWISRRADLMPVYAMIFRRLKAAGADWVYHFPEIGIVELARADDVDKAGAAYSVSQAAVAELEAQKRRAEVERFRAELREANARAREEALDRPPPATRVIEVVQFRTGNARRVARRCSEVDSCVSH
jgi:acyl-CoA reductase-like NAD-dependent aldehyde dehydrogenase